VCCVWLSVAKTCICCSSDPQWLMLVAIQVGCVLGRLSWQLFCDESGRLLVRFEYHRRAPNCIERHSHAQQTMMVAMVAMANGICRHVIAGPMLLECAKKGNIGLMTRIFDECRNLNVSPKDGLGNTPLHYSVQGGHIGMLSLARSLSLSLFLCACVRVCLAGPVLFYINLVYM
jgi:hypothetical protein